MQRFISFLFVLGFFVFLVMTFDNVYTDLVPIQARAVAAACTVKDCNARHQVTQIDRDFTGQHFIVRWENGTVAVSCARTHVVVGERECTAR